jgi:hypothetical protein
MAKSDTSRKAGLQWVSGGVGQYAAQCAVGISTFALGITVTAMAVAAGNFKAAPKSAEAEAAAVAAADSEPTLILGYDANTLFFIAVGAVALFWFTLGGGRKPKVTR